MEVNTNELPKNSEQWAAIDGYCNYEVSWWGRVRNATTGRILKAGRGKNGYLSVVLCRVAGKKTHNVHNLVAREWVSNPDGKRCVDHIDNDKTNNNWENLRYATQAENGWNMKKHSDGSSVYKGVSYNKRRRKWTAQIHVNGAQKRLGAFTIEREAGEAYNAAAIEHFGEFAKINIIESDL
jgi:hypothetical protein